MSSPITCHVLDSTTGLPATGVEIRLYQFKTAEEVLEIFPDADEENLDGTFELGSSHTNDDGRCVDLVDASDLEDLGVPGDYKVVFETKAYFAKQGKETFYPKVEVSFTIGRDEEKKHFHIPLLISPFSYTTYRGS
ncbi:Hydroxyisourate hydrolase [Microstroma glucosiphilum]|uniref:5-hydroxyisourate hydrolase n=1 Tax=Pseudomicrostroma glucosiphilum TaxID=1684307 RepID=A0A316U9M7_9BASI|nr:Hydroxyisourate hydrolase [Pseudomicrostroma glucosiphilum]PWN21967.1 Hydroxyisourate hydrolase [Pseudomicrostroma glucosiphilum]